MRIPVLMSIALLLAGGPLLNAQGRPKDLIGENLFPPELLIKNQEVLGLTDEQRDFIKEETAWAQNRFKELQPQVEAQTAALAAILKQAPVDAAKALQEFDKLADFELQMRRIHLNLSIAIRNKLTPEQLAKATTIKAEWLQKMASAKPPPQSLQTKMMKLKECIQEWRNQGIDPTPVAQVMRELQPLMEDQKFAEAEALLDKALELLAKKP